VSAPYARGQCQGNEWVEWGFWTPVRIVALTQLQKSRSIWVMVAMAVDYDWISVQRAAELAGCSEQYIRRLVLDNISPGDSRTSSGPLEGWRANGKAWMVSHKSVLEFSKTLTTRAKKNASKRTAKKSRKK